jgi:collagenase-like PrtC family protease
MTVKISLGPVLFHWPVDQWLDFYRKMADEADIDRVYLGEVVCQKRAPFYEKHYIDLMERLQRAGKEVVLSTLAQVSVRHDRKCVASVCGMEDVLIEANDFSALPQLHGQRHAIGPYINVYNEGTLHLLAMRGASHFCFAPEIPADSLAVLVKTAKDRALTTEVQVFGRVSLALSARCYHARAHGRTKDNCQYACGEDADGMDVTTIDGKPFLAINGIQTLSYECLNMLQELPALTNMGLDYLRLSPHNCDMVEVARIFRDNLNRNKAASKATLAKVAKVWPDAPFMNGFFHKQPGQDWVVPE